MYMLCVNSLSLPFYNKKGSFLFLIKSKSSIYVCAPFIVNEVYI